MGRDEAVDDGRVRQQLYAAKSGTAAYCNASR